jgi:hypothetical protein
MAQRLSQERGCVNNVCGKDEIIRRFLETLLERLLRDVEYFELEVRGIREPVLRCWKEAS